MDGIIIKAFLILVGLLIFLIGYISWKRKENFETNIETTNLFQDSNLEYISCVAFDNTKSKKRLKKKSKNPESTEETEDIEETENPEDTDTNVKQIYERAPFWSFFVAAPTKELILNSIAEAIYALADQNAGSITGPVYMMIGRNKQLHQSEAWVYIPNMGKDEVPISPEKVVMYNNWLRNLLFSKLYGVSDWLCNDFCDKDLEPKIEKYPKEQKGRITKQQELKDLLKSTPECGCISNKECSFYKIPRGFSANPRNIKKIRSYSIYKFKPVFFTKLGIRILGNDFLDISKAVNGSKLYEGCDTRLLSNNRLFAFEIDKTGAGIYQATPDKPFRESCVKKPEEDQIDRSKVLTTRYDITGKLPRLVINKEDISLTSVIKNKKNKRNEFVKQWTLPTEGRNPYILSMDNYGELQLQDNTDVITSAKFVKA